MNSTHASGFSKEASGLAWTGIGLGALGVGLGGAAAYHAHKTQGDMGVMRQQSRAADSLHAAMLFEGRTGRKLNRSMRTRIGKGFQEANQAYRARFNQGHTLDENDEKTAGLMRPVARAANAAMRKLKTTAGMRTGGASRGKTMARAVSGLGSGPKKPRTWGHSRMTTGKQNVFGGSGIASRGKRLGSL